MSIPGPWTWTCLVLAGASVAAFAAIVLDVLAEKLVGWAFRRAESYFARPSIGNDSETRCGDKPQH